MNPVVLGPEGFVSEDTIYTGELQVNVPTTNALGMMCSGLSVRLEARWTDLEREKDKGTTIIHECEAFFDSEFGTETWLPPGLRR